MELCPELRPNVEGESLSPSSIIWYSSMRKNLHSKAAQNPTCLCPFTLVRVTALVEFLENWKCLRIVYGLLEKSGEGESGTVLVSDI